MQAPYSKELEKAGVAVSDETFLTESANLKEDDRVHVLHEVGPGPNFLKDIEQEQKAALENKS